MAGTAWPSACRPPGGLRRSRHAPQVPGGLWCDADSNLHRLPPALLVQAPCPAISAGDSPRARRSRPPAGCRAGPGCRSGTFPRSSGRCLSARRAGRRAPRPTAPTPCPGPAPRHPAWRWRWRGSSRPCAPKIRSRASRRSRHRAIAPAAETPVAGTAPATGPGSRRRLSHTVAGRPPRAPAPRTVRASVSVRVRRGRPARRGAPSRRLSRPGKPWRQPARRNVRLMRTSPSAAWWFGFSGSTPW